MCSLNQDQRNLSYFLTIIQLGKKYSINQIQQGLYFWRNTWVEKYHMFCDSETLQRYEVISIFQKKKMLDFSTDVNF